MCTCISTRIGNKNYFGRTMDIDRGFGQRVVLTPRNYSYKLKCGEEVTRHYAILGMATVECEYPLYADAVNERGLSIAGLNFPASAHYEKELGGVGELSLAPYELIPFLLGRADDVRSAKKVLSQLRLCDIAFNGDIATSPLHWQIADRYGRCIVLESSKDGIKIYDNRVGVLTNEPPFYSQLAHLENFRGLSNYSKGGKMKERFKLSESSFGGGAIGLPGDASSLSRFVRAAYLSAYSEFDENEEENLAGLFHIFEGVSIVKGCVKNARGKAHYTHYISVMDTAEGIYHYKRYGDASLCSVPFTKFYLDGDALIECPL